MRAVDTLSIRFRLGVSILILVSAIVLALAGLHLRKVVGGALEETEAHAHLVGESVQQSLLEAREGGLRLAPPLLQRILTRNLIQNPQSPSNILILDKKGAVVASARPESGDAVAGWTGWQQQGEASRVLSLFGNGSDYALEIPPTADLPYTVRVLFSRVGLRTAIAPQLLDLLLLSVLSLIVAAVLAYVVSQVVHNSLDRLGKRIDCIARGEIPKAEDNLPELATLETKLSWLGRQFSGARTDALHMRNNVEKMLRQLDEAIFVFGPDNRLQMAGEPAERLLARSRHELIGEPVSSVFPQWTGPGALLNRAFTGGEGVREAPVSLERPNLPPVHLLMTVEPVEYSDQYERGMVVALRNADTRKNLRADLNTGRQLSAMNGITSGVAHEIKNPLNAMMLHLQIAQDKAARSVDASPELETVQRELMRLDRVVNVLLDFQRPLEPKLADHDLGEIAEEVANLIRPQAESQGVELSVDRKVEEAKIIGDADLLKQGLLNIAVNGLEAVGAKQGGVLRFVVDHSGSEYVISIEDDGPGIPPEIRDRIFNLYFTTKQKRGVGLALTYRIVLMHSGNIVVDSEVGKGACFRILLPARSLSVEPAEVLA